MPNTLNVSQKMTKNKVKKYLDETNVNQLTPTDHTLREWGMSKKRFTQIKQNTGDELRYTEAIKILELLNPYYPNLQPWELYDYPVNGNTQSHE